MTNWEPKTMRTGNLMKNAARVDMEPCGNHTEITCCIFGAMVHTIFCSNEKAEETYKSVKRELQDFLSTHPDEQAIIKFCDEFVKSH